MIFVAAFLYHFKPQSYPYVKSHVNAVNITTSLNVTSLAPATWRGRTTHGGWGAPGQRPRRTRPTGRGRRIENPVSVSLLELEIIKRHVTVIEVIFTWM